MAIICSHCGSALPTTSVSEPVAEHIRNRHEALELAKSLNGADFAGDLEPPPGDTVEAVARSLSIVAAAYDWTVSPEGYIIGLVAGDMGYAATSMKVDAETLAAIYPAPSEPVSDLVKRLRASGTRDNKPRDGMVFMSICDEAASLIEAQQAEIQAANERTSAAVADYNDMLVRVLKLEQALDALPQPPEAK